MCVSTHVLHLSGIEHLRRAIVSCSTSPPKLNPQTGLLPQARTWVSAPLCGVRRPVERVLSLRPFDGWREGRGGKRSWVARPTNHLVLG